MAWAKVDDRLHAHPKWRRASKGARALWTTALSWCSSFPSDGEVPADMLAYLGGTPAEAKILVEVGLWNETSGGFSFHEWAERNPDSASTRAALAKKSEGGRRGNHTKWHVKRNVLVPGCEFCESDDRSHTDSDSDRSTTRPVPVPVPIRERTSPAVPDTFDSWWASWPRKEARAKAQTAYGKALKSIDADKLARLTAEWFEARPDLEPRFIPLAASWLNARRWEDERPTSAPTTHQASPRYLTADEMRARREAGEA